MVISPSTSGFLSGDAVVGRVTALPFWSIGVTTMKMISSTRQTSTSGVTLISALTSPVSTLAAMARLTLQEEIHQLGGGVRHLDLEPLELVLEIVEEPDRDAPPPHPRAAPPHPLHPS